MEAEEEKPAEELTSEKPEDYEEETEEKEDEKEEAELVLMDLMEQWEVAQE